jgi:hypothetical protein
MSFAVGLGGVIGQPLQKTKKNKDKDKVSVFFSREGESPIQYCLAVSLFNGC